MSDQWERNLKAFLNRTGEELKRAGGEIKTEAQKLLHEVKDPAKHQKVKAGLREFGQWAKRTAEEVGELIEKGVRRAEGTMGREGTVPPPAPPPAAVTTPAAPAPKPAKKTVGGKRKTVKPRAAPAAKKSIGRKKPPVR